MPDPVSKTNVSCSSFLLTLSFIIGRLPTRSKWTEVWSRIFLGKVFDITGQRERAVIQYKQAERTNDNTQGALEEAAKYLKSPYRR